MGVHEKCERKKIKWYTNNTTTFELRYFFYILILGIKNIELKWVLESKYYPDNISVSFGLSTVPNKSC